MPDPIILVSFWTTQYGAKFVARELWVERVGGGKVVEFKSGKLYVLYGILNILYCTIVVP